jgi:hypothetical protein
MTGLKRMAVRGVAVAVCIAALACAGDAVSPLRQVSPTGAAQLDRGESPEPNFLSPAPGAPSIANPQIVFTAIKGQDIIARMYYRPTRIGHDSVVYAQFRVPSQALLAAPDGHLINNGESVRITMTLVDVEHGIIDFQPSGLRFSSKNPAVLKINYTYANRDLNGDGVVDARDALLRAALHIICRETDSSPWVPIPSSNSTELNEVEAAIRGFSGYAVDY